MTSGRPKRREPYRVDLSPPPRANSASCRPATPHGFAGPILALAIEPRPPAATPLVDSDWWRLRIGDLRIVYAIDDANRLVIVLRVARRDESTYRR